MKKILFSFLAIGLFINSFGQNDYKKRPALGVSFILNDFKTAAKLRATSLSEVLRTKQYKQTKDMAAGLALSYIQGISNNIDFTGSISGSFVDYPVPGKVSLGNTNLLLEAVATGNVKLTSDKYWISPFITAGVGASKYKGYYAAFVPAGLGLQVNLFDEAYILLNTQYRIPITENAAYHFYHSFGIAGNIGKPKAPPVMPVVLPPVVEAPKDRDGDGIIDDNDKCPDEKGVARYQGCPVPDTDKDGVNDEEDKCPAVAGPVTNFGCPIIPQVVVDKINYAAKNILFATGSAKLLPKSFKSLNEVAKIMADDKTLQLDIDGHTDSQGKPEKNQVLSENRAASVKAYLASKGVEESRMISAGHGQDMPVADNKTTAGRTKNRRVEMKARNY